MTTKLPSIEHKKQFLFKEILIINDKSFDSKHFKKSYKTKNENYKQDLEKCLKNIETFGEIDSLKKIPTNIIRSDRKISMIENLKNKIMEISCLIQEDQNQDPETKKNLKIRYKNTKACIEYLENIKVLFPSL